MRHHNIFLALFINVGVSTVQKFANGGIQSNICDRAMTMTPGFVCQVSMRRVLRESLREEFASRQKRM